MIVIKKTGKEVPFDGDKIKAAISKSAERVLECLTEEDKNRVVELVKDQIQKCGREKVTIQEIHQYVEVALDQVSPATAKSYREFRDYKQEFKDMMEDIYNESEKILFVGDQDNANMDSSMVSTKRVMELNALEKALYKKMFLSADEAEAEKDGYIYIHDKSARRFTMNCSLFRIADVLSGGFEMGNIWYNEPKTLDTAFDVIADIVLSTAAQQYGGFTLPRIDSVLAPYAEKSYKKYKNECLELIADETVPKSDQEYWKEIERKADEYAYKKVQREMEQGMQCWEYKFNTVASSRGDYPFIAITFGLDTSRFGRMASITALKEREEGQGKKGFKKPVLFPKLIFLYDENLHGPGKELEDVFDAAVECSSRCMYPDVLALTGEGYVPEMYKKYGAVISPMGECKLAHVKLYEPLLSGCA